MAFEQRDGLQPSLEVVLHRPRREQTDLMGDRALRRGERLVEPPPEHLEDAVTEYAGRRRRFGGLDA